MTKKTGIKELTNDSFHIYGSFANMTPPSGPKLGFGKVEFYRDMAILSLGQIGEASFSVTRVQKRDNIIDAMECHQHTGEACLPLDGDILVHVAPASQKERIIEIGSYRNSTTADPAGNRTPRSA